MRQLPNHSLPCMPSVQLPPSKQYKTLLSTGNISFDVTQDNTIQLLDQLYHQLVAKERWFTREKQATQGLYLWGKVGRGKTFLMDLLFQALPVGICKRQHFHHFMQDVYRQLEQYQGRPNPLLYIAKQFRQQYKALCFDEFFVSDIGDAMLLGNLLQHLFDLGVTVVFTSNCAPDELYRNGLQRARFLPAIAAIKQHTRVIHLDSNKDYRQRKLTDSPCYYVLPTVFDDKESLHNTLLHQHGLHQHNNTHEINILNRPIKLLAQGRGNNQSTIAFCFEGLCLGPRSHFDYVELARMFKTILLFNVPELSGDATETIKARGTEDHDVSTQVSTGEIGQRQVVLAPMDDGARRFIALVDECYDRRVNLIVTANVPLDQLYTSGSLLFEFERAKSRLMEMASLEYQRAVAIG